jgi:L-amino acid N-acyltransferase YncA
MVETIIRPAALSDAAACCAIYNHYVLHTVITFEEEEVSVAEMETRLREIITVLPWLVLEEQRQMVGYAYASKWRSRSAYRYAAESTVYLHPDATGRGLGRRLYDRLIAELRRGGLHSVIGGVALPNAASQRLHEKVGFKQVAHFAQVGWKFGRWLDVGYWELILAPEA